MTDKMAMYPNQVGGLIGPNHVKIAATSTDTIGALVEVVAQTSRRTSRSPELSFVSAVGYSSAPAP